MALGSRRLGHVGTSRHRPLPASAKTSRHLSEAGRPTQLLLLASLMISHQKQPADPLIIDEMLPALATTSRHPSYSAAVAGLREVWKLADDLTLRP